MKTTLTWVVIAVIIIGAMFLLARDGDSDTNEPNTNESSTEEVTEGDGTTIKVPAPGNEGVEEMVVVNDSKGGVRTVTYTDDGFEPNNLEISPGEIVRFVNESSRGMWVASDIHPTHRNYPERNDDDCFGSSFDQCSSVSAGDFWEFTFSSVGDHGYHNHARASNRGTITVK